MAQSEPDSNIIYNAIRSLFAFNLHIFYNDIEVAGRHNLPQSGPILIALNHCNSLADTAVSMISLSPLLVRYTCKDTLLKDKRWGWIVRGSKSIGIKRKQDHKGQKVDNQNVFEQLFKELSNDCIVAMYPEGVGKYRSSLSPFRTGLARIAINFIVQNPSKFVNIVPVGLTYLHREKFRSSVAVRIGQPILLNLDILKQKKQTLSADEKESEFSLNSDEIYKIGKNVTTELTQKFSNLVISASDWHMLSVSHLARSVMFPRSSSARKGTYLNIYVDLARQFNNVFRDKSEDQLVANCYSELSAYWKVLWLKGLKDYRILQLSNYKNSNSSWLYKKCSIFGRLLYRTTLSLVLCGVSLPGIVSSMPIYLVWEWLRRGRIRKGIEGSYDGLAMNKMFMMFFGVNFLSIIYGSTVWYKLGWRKGMICAGMYPFALWLSVRSWQEGYSSLKSVLSLLKMLFMSTKKESVLIECRENVYDLVLEVVNKYNIGYNDGVMGEEDKNTAQLTKRLSWSWLTMIFGRTKRDWNETIRLWDIPTDIFHLDERYQSV